MGIRLFVMCLQCASLWSIAVALVCWSPTVRAAPNALPVVLVLDLPGDAGAGMQERFATELGLALDAFMMIRVTVDERFQKQNLGEQLRQAQPLIKRYKALAAAWIDRPVPGVVLVTLVVIESGRVLVRTIPADSPRASEAELALAARELLGTAYLLEPTPPPEVEDITVSVAQRVGALRNDPKPSDPVAAAPPPPPRARSPFGLGADIGVVAPLAGDVGEQQLARLRLGCHVGARSGWQARLFASGAIGVGGGEALDRTRLAAALGAGYAVALGDHVALTPVMLIEAGVDRFKLDTGTEPQAFRSTSVALGLAPEIAFQVTLGTRVVLFPLLGWSPSTSETLRRSDGGVVRRGARLAWSIGIGWVASL